MNSLLTFYFFFPHLVLTVLVAEMLLP